MNALTASLAARQSAAAKAQDRAAQESAALAAIATQWPESLPVRFTCYHGPVTRRGYGGTSIKADVATRADAIAYLSALPLLPLAVVKGTFTSIRPESWFDPADLERATSIRGDILPAYWDASYLEGYPATCTLNAFAEIGGERVSLGLEIKADPFRWVEVRTRSGRQGRGSSLEAIDAVGAPDGNLIRWAGGSGWRPGHLSAYFDDEPGAGPTLSDYLERVAPASSSLRWMSR